MTFSIFINGGEQFSGLHQEIDSWIAKYPGIHYDKTAGWSYIDGVVFFNKLVFLNQEDMLAFKLKFAGRVYGDYS